MALTQVSTGGIKDGTIVDADIHPSAAIAASKLNVVTVTSADVGVTVQPYDADTAKLDVAQTFTSAQTFSAGAGDSAGSYRIIPQNSKTSSYTLTATDTGKHINITTGGVTVPASIFSAGDVVTIFNDSTSSQQITQGASVNLVSAASVNTGNKQLAGNGICTILCVGTNKFVISGVGLS